MASEVIFHEKTGKHAVIKRVRTAKNISMRWKDADTLSVTAPLYALHTEIIAALDAHAVQLLQIQPGKESYPENHVFRFPDWTVTLHRGPVSPQRILQIEMSRTSDWQITLSHLADLHEAAVTRAINHAVLTVAHHMASKVLLPRGKELAAGLGLRAARWKVSFGQRILGTCNSEGEISLSEQLMLMPHELRDYVILHELGHLTEMNHSARFHSIVDHYCGGSEAELDARLKAFRTPLLKA